MRVVLLMAVFAFAGCTDSREDTAKEFIADCKKTGATMDIALTIEGRFGMATSITCRGLTTKEMLK